MPLDGSAPGRAREEGLETSPARLEAQIAHLEFMARAAQRLASDTRSMPESQRAPGWGDRLAALDWTVTAVQDRLRRLAE